MPSSAQPSASPMAARMLTAAGLLSLVVLALDLRPAIGGAAAPRGPVLIRRSSMHYRDIRDFAGGATRSLLRTAVFVVEFNQVGS